MRCDAVLCDAGPEQVLCAYLHATLLERALAARPSAADDDDDAAWAREAVVATHREASAQAAGLERALSAAGWEVASAHHLEDVHSRLQLLDGARAHEESPNQ
jgi:hypothetical protein